MSVVSTESFEQYKALTSSLQLQHEANQKAAQIMQAWDVRNTCKHSGAVLPLPSAPVGRGVDGIDAMA
jgi:hypothetical protein